VLVAAAGCGGEERPAGPEKPPPGTLEALWKRPGDDVGLVQGTSDYGPGRNRFLFLVVRQNGEVVERPRARVWVARGLKRRPFLETTARLEPIGVRGGEHGGARGIFVTHVRLTEPGKYWLLAEPVGGRPVQGLATLVVKERTDAPASGERAIASRTPTLASTGGDVAALTTKRPPDRALLRYSVADSLADRVPFVVAFATPKFCTSRTCGPAVDVVERVRREFEGDGIRFIHVEIYQDNDPQKGVNRWVKEWRLPSEPWVFVVGRDGRIAAAFEGAVSVAELRAAVSRLT
jgi:hypothetical protein